MRAPSDHELLSLWDRCVVLHPIDRSLFLSAWDEGPCAAHSLADQPLGALNRRLLAMRLAWFGSQIDALVDCPACGEPLDLVLEGEQLLEGLRQAPDSPTDPMDGITVRAVTSRDLAAVSHHTDASAAGLALLERCLVQQQGEPLPSLSSLTPGDLVALEAALAAKDPAADIGLATTCESCGHAWIASLDITALLWEEIGSRVRSLLSEVDALARVYGWSEPEILAIQPHRRSMYLELARR